jgi:molybdopterin-binding protein
MEAGVRNKLTGTIEEIKSDGIMTLVHMAVEGWHSSPIVASVMTTESLEDAGFKEGDQVEALIKAVNVVFVKH